MSVWRKKTKKYRSTLFPQEPANKWNKHTLVITLLGLSYWKNIVFQFIDTSKHPMDVITYYKLKEGIIEMRNY